MTSRLLESENCVLVIVDVQEKLLPAMNDADAAIKNMQILLEGFRLTQVPVLYTEQYPKGLGNTISQLSPRDGETVIEKTTFSCMSEPAFANALKATGKKNIVLAGIESHVCVLQTAMQLLQAGYSVFLPADAVTSRSLDNKSVALDRMRAAGIEVTCAESCLFELLRDAKHPAFKEVSKLLR